MRSRSDYLTWKKVFAAGLLLHPILIVPMAPSGPLGGSNMLPIGLALVFALSILVAAGVFVGNRPAIAFGIFTALECSTGSTDCTRDALPRSSPTR